MAEATILFSSHEAFDPEAEGEFLVEGLTGIGCDGPFSWNDGLRISENRRIYWEVQAADPGPASGVLVDLPAGMMTSRKNGREGDFQALNLLGQSTMEFRNHVLRFTFISEKITYDVEFRALTELLADCARGFLHDWAGAGLGFSGSTADTPAVDWERYHVLVGSLDPDKLRAALAQVQARPDSVAAYSESWVASGQPLGFRAIGSASRWGRAWVAYGDRSLPSEVLSRTQYEDFQTPANRFLVHVLAGFYGVSERASAHLKGKWGTEENLRWMQALQEALWSPFFRQIAPDPRPPVSSQILQKRPGYREIFQAWILSETSSILRWERPEGGFAGRVHNIANLYEFWCFFVLYHVLTRRLGFVLEGPGVQFRNRDGLGLSLVKGKESALCLRSPGEPFGLCARLYYNRTYGVDENGSYTSPLHPDFSLAVFPDYCTDEADAIEKEKVLLLHFDAKYRVDRLPALEVLADEDGSDEGTRTFKKADLYKMHTYMDAIRRSAGSYIFYPGDPEPDPVGKEPPYRKYAELFPGVGAFSLRPLEANWEDQRGTLALSEFLVESVKVHRNRFRRYFRQMKSTRENWRESAPREVQAIDDVFPAGLFREKAPKDTRVLVGFVPADLRSFLDAEKLFYFWATDRDGRPFQVDREVFLADYFLPCFALGGGRFETSAKLYSISPLAPGQAREAVSKDEISHARYPTYPEARAHRVNYYYQLSLGNVEGEMPRLVYPFTPDSPGRGFLPRVVDFESLARWIRARP